MPIPQHPGPQGAAPHDTAEKPLGKTSADSETQTTQISTTTDNDPKTTSATTASTTSSTSTNATVTHHNGTAHHNGTTTGTNDHGDNTPTVTTATTSHWTATSTTSATNNAISPDGSSSSGDGTSLKTILAIALPLGIVGLAILLGAIWFLRRRRKRHHAPHHPTFGLAGHQATTSTLVAVELPSTSQMATTPKLATPDFAAASSLRPPGLDAQSREPSPAYPPPESAQSSSQTGVAARALSETRRSMSEQAVQNMTSADPILESPSRSHATDTRFPLHSANRNDDNDDAVSDISDANDRGNAHDQDLDDMSSVSSFDVDSPRSPREHRRFQR